MPTQEISRAWRRLVIMLGLSMLLHAWLMQSQYGKGEARRSAGGAAIAAYIQPAVSETSVSAPVLALPGIVASKAPLQEADAAPARAAPAPAAAAVLSQPSDPTYYAVGELDVFPKALVKPDLSAALGANHEPSAGKVRATLLIDEAGVVKAVRAERGADAAAGDVESVAKELLLRTRFTPARNKEGRIVKAQVLVALDYDTRATPFHTDSR